MENNNQVALQLKLQEVVDEYDMKVEGAQANVELFETAGKEFTMGTIIQGTFGNESFDIGRVYVENIKSSLKKSAWQFVYNRLQIDRIATATDKKKFSQDLEREMPEFTLENVRESFADYLIDPRSNILRGVAEVFSTLDPAYKSHEKVKIGAKGLPKRIIVGGLSDYGYGWGWDKIKDVLNALAAYQGIPMVGYKELEYLRKEGELKNQKTIPESEDGRVKEYILHARGIWLKKFKNGNGHLFFDKIALRDINMALAEYYGDVLPDETGEKPTKKAAGTNVSKDLQYYPTPMNVVENLLHDIYISDDSKILEPSCGCGRIMDGVRADNAKCTITGFEYDVGRANEARAKGHNVVIGNFLESIPTPEYDYVIINPPFASKHYVKHIEHSMKFLKEGGRLVAILPSTARYDHGKLDYMGGDWSDLPTGSFRESGTNVSISILKVWKR